MFKVISFQVYMLVASLNGATDTISSHGTLIKCEVAKSKMPVSSIEYTCEQRTWETTVYVWQDRG